MEIFCVKYDAPRHPLYGDCVAVYFKGIETPLYIPLKTWDAIYIFIKNELKRKER